MKRRDFLKKLGIGVAIAPAVPAFLSEAVKADEPTVYAPEKPAPLGASCSAGDSIAWWQPQDGMLIGTIIPYHAMGYTEYRIYTDHGWMPCNGQYALVSNMPELFRKIGFKYGNQRNYWFRLPMMN